MYAQPTYAMPPSPTGVAKDVVPTGSGAPMQMTTIIYAPTAGQVAASTDVLSALPQLPGLWLAKWIDLLNIVTGCERNNRYKLRVWDPVSGADKATDGIRSQDIFKMKEQSDCCCRLCLGPARAFKMALYPYAEGQYPPPDADVFFLPGAVTLERPFRCTFACLQRPVLRVRHGSVGYIGEVRCG